MTLAPAALAESLAAQIDVVAGLARAAGTRLRYVKAHGALYNDMAVDTALATVVVEAVRAAGELVLLVQSGTAAEAEAARLGVRWAGEGFADRAYRADGTLVARRQPGALLTDEATVVAQARAIALQGRAPVLGGGWVPVSAASLCVHGDTPGAAALAAAVRASLEEAGVVVAPFAA